MGWFMSDRVAQVAADLNAFVAPTPEEVLDFAKANAISEEIAKEFYEHYDKCKWRARTGDKLTSWEGVLVKWSRRRLEQEQHPVRPQGRMSESTRIEDELERLRIENHRLQAAYERSMRERDDLRTRINRIFENGEGGDLIWHRNRGCSLCLGRMGSRTRMRRKCWALARRLCGRW